MRILIDGYWWDRGPTSLRDAAVNVIKTWNTRFGDDDVAVFTRTLCARSRAELAARKIEVFETAIWPHALAVSVGMPKAARAFKAEAVLSHNFTPLSRTPTFVLIHDLMFIDRPEWFTKKERVYFAFMPVLARRSHLVFTTSETEAQRVRRLSPRLRTGRPVGLGVGEHLLEQPSIGPSILLNHDKFVLTVSRLNIRKNLGVLLEAAALSTRISATCPLVIVGEQSGRLAQWPAVTDGLVATGRVIFLSGVENSELRWLYERAALFVFTSHGEGFGLPPLEARRFGCPVIVSDLPIFRETLGTEAAFVDPDSPAEIALTMDTLLTGSDAGEFLRERSSVFDDGRYSWNKTVDTMREAMVATAAPREDR